MRVTTDTETGPVGTLLEQPPERDHSQIEWTNSWGQVTGLLGAPATGGASVLGVAVTCGTLGIAAGEFTTRLLEE